MGGICEKEVFEDEMTCFGSETLPDGGTKRDASTNAD